MGKFEVGFQTKISLNKNDKGNSSKIYENFRPYFRETLLDKNQKKINFSRMCRWSFKKIDINGK